MPTAPAVPTTPAPQAQTAAAPTARPAGTSRTREEAARRRARRERAQGKGRARRRAQAATSGSRAGRASFSPARGGAAAVPRRGTVAAVSRLARAGAAGLTGTSSRPTPSASSRSSAWCAPRSTAGRTTPIVPWRCPSGRRAISVRFTGGFPAASASAATPPSVAFRPEVGAAGHA